MRKLLDDAKILFDWDRFSTALALAVLAQEEFAKAFCSSWQRSKMIIPYLL